MCTCDAVLWEAVLASQKNACRNQTSTPPSAVQNAVRLRTPRIGADEAGINPH